MHVFGWSSLPLPLASVVPWWGCPGCARYHPRPKEGPRKEGAEGQQVDLP